MQSTYGRPRVSLFDQLPAELVSYILDLSTHAPSYEQDPSQGVFSMESTIKPFELASCLGSRLRRIAVGTSSLWTSILITHADLYCQDEDGEWMLNPDRLLHQLVRSKEQPIDVVIYARDEDECDLSIHNDTNYRPTFGPKAMRAALKILLSQVRRWRSLAIYTDMWAPMHEALSCLDDVPLSINNGVVAPFLESITLHRHNPYVATSGSGTFVPHHLRDVSPHPFNALLGNATGDARRFPRLRHLNLYGVHLNWDALPDLLPTAMPMSTSSRQGLQTLELAYHAEDVRPSTDAFFRMLGAAPRLRKFVLRVSGPHEPATAFAPAVWSSRPHVSLPLLEDLDISYLDAWETAHILSRMHAPNLRALSIEDGTPGDSIEDEDASGLLGYIGDGLLVDNRDANRTLVWTSDACAGAPFPKLEKISLRKVLARAPSLTRCLYGTRDLKELEMEAPTLEFLGALFPDEQGAVPCPKLETLSARNLRDFQTECARECLARVLEARRHCKAAGVEATLTTCAEEELLRRAALGDDEEEEDEDSFMDEDYDAMDFDYSESDGAETGTETDEESGGTDHHYHHLSFDTKTFSQETEADAFKLGGTFNDPVFDAQYAAVWAGLQAQVHGGVQVAAQ
ncbi:hypothetical protein CONPUDRAFT_85311 [Coniophora puteana RWD-64-598 SS2]|uniref:F-box domain-containing protein n=1 Tax=Coniophora puteana (strain RWD-64-598) TaxID=741705 RepID=A0A5M3M996_CONPW|nr:uncharacterized protein CONPUDRAFT_85311 [Coniophora puteana RWD-64-598 SS2]EIW75506.1 hypothetical protein CONPUDRAFT_85311 [Coniophora puteana RWD-64-598 SS2]